MGTTPQLIPSVETQVTQEEERQESRCATRKNMIVGDVLIKGSEGARITKSPSVALSWNHLTTGLRTSVELLILNKWDKGVILQANLEILATSSGFFVRGWTFPSSSYMLETCSPRCSTFLPVLCFRFPCLALKIPLLKGNLDFKAVDFMLWLMKVFLLMDVATTRLAFKRLNSQ